MGCWASLSRILGCCCWHGEGHILHCRHPIQTGRGVITSIAHPIQTYNAITEDLSEKSGTLRGQGSIVGDVLIGVATAGTAGIAAKTGTVAKVVRKLKRTPDVPDTNVPGGVAPNRPSGFAPHGTNPLPGTRVRPEGIPDGWRIRPTKGKGALIPKSE